ncbi:MAG TPA: cytochrome d ubiquinol oxidase subunit II [bacterium]|nr:cytochrome d ubiquinol oxidase subunit II [bacterium]
MDALQAACFFVTALVFAVYFLLGGPFAGAGFWSLLSKNDDERARSLSASAPAFSGSGFWLAAGGATLYAAFPGAFFVLWSAFGHIAVFALLALVLRFPLASMLRKRTAQGFRMSLLVLYAAASVVPPLIFGLMIGNVLEGMPTDSGEVYSGSFVGLFSPYAILAGLVAFSLTATQGAALLFLRDVGGDPECARRRVVEMGVACAMLLFIYFGAMAILVPDLLKNYEHNVLLAVFPVLAVGGSVAASLFAGFKRRNAAFISAGVSVFASVASAAVAVFPNAVPTWDPQHPGLTLASASSSQMVQEATIAATAAFALVFAAFRIATRSKTPVENGGKS